jgi:hypothetical protein
MNAPQSPAPVAGAVEAKRLVSRLVVAACLQEREPSEANQNAYRAARDAVEAALHPQPSPAVAVEADSQWGTVREVLGDFKLYDWIDADGEMLPLTDLLCHKGDTSIERGSNALNMLCDDIVAALAARTAPAVAESQWMPIETAPRYGRVLVWGDPHMGRCVASAGWRNETPDVIRWEVVNDIVVSPTHWMPLPPAPSTDGSGSAQEGQAK